MVIHTHFIFTSFETRKDTVSQTSKLHSISQSEDHSPLSRSRALQFKVQSTSLESFFALSFEGMIRSMFRVINDKASPPRSLTNLFFLLPTNMTRTSCLCAL